MARIFNFTTLSTERIGEIQHTARGSYVYDLRRATADRLERLSTGFTRDALDILAGRFVMMESFFNDEGTIRFRPVAEQFTADERVALGDGSFAFTAFRNAFYYEWDNDAFRFAGMCTECGKVFYRIPASHTCGAISCNDCGTELHTDDEKRVHLCTSCLAERIARKHGYHGRFFRSTPVFEKPEARPTEFHFGGEIEVDGYGRGSSFGDEETGEFSRMMNSDPFAPFMEFEGDASLCGGVECITRPMTFSGFWKMRKKLNAFYDKAREFGGVFERANGLHFHIDRTAFGESVEERGKCAVLIEMMVYKYFDFFKLISRREAGCFGYAKKKDGVDGLYSAFTHATYQEHTLAVNGSGTNTIEIRFFGGHISTGDEFLACLDIVQALARWAKCATLGTAERATPCDLVKYIRKCDNVLAFVEGVIPKAPHTSNGDRWHRDFVTALKARIARNNAGTSTMNEEV